MQPPAARPRAAQPRLTPRRQRAALASDAAKRARRKHATDASICAWQLLDLVGGHVFTQRRDALVGPCRPCCLNFPIYGVWRDLDQFQIRSQCLFSGKCQDGAGLVPGGLGTSKTSPAFLKRATIGTCLLPRPRPPSSLSHEFGTRWRPPARAGREQEEAPLCLLRMPYCSSGVWP